MNGWTRLLSRQVGNFYAEAYQNGTEVFIAYRGMDSSVSDLSEVILGAYTGTREPATCKSEEKSR